MEIIKHKGYWRKLENSDTRYSCAPALKLEQIR